MAKASFGYDVRLPSEEELLGDGYVIAPAGNLTPERNISVNIGMLFDLTGKASSNLQIELNGYYMHLKDMIRFTGGFLQSQYQNFGEMRTLGMEAEVKADMTRWLYGYVNATYQDLRDVRKYEQNTIVANPTKGSRMPNIPYLMANAGLEFHKENLFHPVIWTNVEKINFTKGIQNMVQIFCDESKQNIKQSDTGKRRQQTA